MVKPLPEPERWPQLSALLDELLDLPETARAHRLGELHLTNAELADELRALLAGGVRADSGGFLRGAPDLAACLPDADSGPGLAGQRLGAYRLESPLGQGGGGSVWRARREDGRFDVAVAIKLLHLSLLGSAGAARFRREGQILARLKHAHIASLLDAGVTPGGQPYLVIELVQGDRIDRHCDAQRLGVQDRLALFEDVLAAVAHAHIHGVIHRDLKPGNILVTGDGCVKLLDFGIAKLLDDETSSAPATELTRIGGRALTPDYAAPEQLRGEGVTTGTDVYALGVLLYHLLIGRHPTAPAGAAASEVIRATLEAEPARLSHAIASSNADAAALRSATVQRLQQTLRGDLETIVAHALRKVPSERYPTVAAMAEDLRRYRAHEPVLAQPDSALYRTRKFVRRNRGAVLAGLLTALAVFTGLAGTAWQAQRAERQAELAAQQAQRATREKQNALVDLEHAEAMTDLMTAILGSVANKAFTAADLLRQAGEIVDKEYESAPATRAYLLGHLATLWSTLGDQAHALQLAQQAYASAQAGSDPHQRLTRQCLLAGMLTVRGDFAKSRQLLDAALAEVPTIWPDEPEHALGCRQQRAVLNLEEGRPDAALGDAQEALKLLGQARPGQADMRLMLREIVADAFAARGQLGFAVREYDAVVAELKRLGRIELTASMVTFNQFGVTLMRGGQVLRAADVLGQAMRIAQANGQPERIDIPTQTNYARALQDLGRSSEAQQQFEQALARAERSGQPRFIGNVASLSALAACELGQLARCEALLTLGAKHLEAILPAGHPGRSAPHLLRARLALARDHTGEAMQHVQAALDLLGAAAGTMPQRIQAMTLRARIDLARGDTAAAVSDARAAVQMAREANQDFPASTTLGKALLVLGQALQDDGKAEGALASWMEAAAQLEHAAGPESPGAQEARKLMAAVRPR